MIRFSKQTGFSLVELMIVVAIMAILAAIAIPSFLKFQTKAKESEARNNLAAIRTCEESYRAEEDKYLLAGPTPGTVPLAGTVAWLDTQGGFPAIGFEPSGQVRFAYSVVPRDNDIHYDAYAQGNLTGEDPISFQITDEEPKPIVHDSNVGPATAGGATP